MAGDPADIRSTPIDIRGPEIKDILARHLRGGQIAGGGVENALGLSGVAAGVEDEEVRFTVHLLGGTIRIDVMKLAMPPDVAAFLDLHFVPGALEHDDALDGFRE